MNTIINHHIMSHYAILPKLPVPSLNASLDRFLSALKPLLTPSEFSETIRTTKTFADKQAPYLQGKLIQLAEETDNWASHARIQTRYLTNQSLLFTNAPVGLLSKFELSDSSKFLALVSRCLSTALNRIQALRTERYPQEMVGSVPLCMEQYKQLVGGYRLPGLKIDSYSYSPDSRHIIVMHAGGVYKVPVYSTGREEPVSVQEMYSLLSQVLSHPQRTCGDRHRSVGLLTALERDQWYLAREELRMSSINRDSLAAVEGCLFGVCLDNSDAGTPTDLLKQSRFGDNTGNFKFFNRWFGLATQAVFTRDGYIAWMIEHSMVDGAVISLFAIPPDSEETILETSSTSDKVELLNWEITPSIQSKLQEAKLFLSNCYNKYDIHTFHFTDYGKEFIKSHGIYFQGYIQLALQLAYYKLYHGLAATYQPVSMRRFRCGRLEQPHTVSEESKAFVESMTVNSECSIREKYELMLSGIKKHRDITTDAVQGNVYLKHLQALKMLAESEQLQIEFFQNKSFKIFTEPLLCISCVHSFLPLLSTYSLSRGEGHYVIFRPAGDLVNFSISTILKSSNQVTSSQFGSALLSSLLELRDLVLSQGTVSTNSKL